MDSDRSTDEPSCSARLSGEAFVFKALGDKRRLRMLHRIAEAPGICSCKLLEEYDMSQSTLSHHMKLLCEAGLVSCEKDGKWVHYSLDSDGIERAVQALQDLKEEARLSRR